MAGNSKDSKILAYKDMINQLNKTISTQTELIQSLQKTLEADLTWEQELPDDITVPEHKRNIHVPFQHVHLPPAVLLLLVRPGSLPLPQSIRRFSQHMPVHSEVQ